MKEKEIEIKRYQTKFNEGLSTYQIDDRFSQGLLNKTKIKISGTYFKIIVKNIFTFFNILLIIIGAILIAFKLWSSTIFLIILILNTTIGLVQDIRAKMAVDKLSLIEKDTITVIRNGKEEVISTEELVLDDIILCQKETKIPCDSILIKGQGMVDESLLTGESLPSKKILNSKLFSGTYVTNGKFYARVDKVGEENYISKLQLKSKEYKEVRSRMFIQLNKLFKIIAIIVIALGFLELIEFGAMSLLSEDFSFEYLYDWLKDRVILQLSGSLVSMIPSGMYLLTSTTLAVGVINLTRDKVLLKDMYSQETLARVDTLCIDKTGTITDGTMSVFNYDLISKKIRKDRFEALIASYCLELGEENATSRALLKYFESKEIFEIKSYIPFSSVYKYSAVDIEDIGTLVIGAYDFFNIINKDEIKEKVEENSKAGFRVIVVGLSKTKLINNKLPDDLEAIALIYLQDHIREEAKQAIKWFNNNGVNIKVISGDNPLTVYKIAEGSGITDAKNFISLEGLSDAEIKEAALKYTVFGRVTPEQKELIVKTLRDNSHTVAMIGDGVNDILSLKSADVSIALESGSKASKDVSNLILLNNDFTKLPNVIYQGRRVINNLQRTCSLFLTKTVFAIFLNVFFLILGFVTQFGTKNAVLWPFATNNFYAWELITIGISSFLLALEPNSNKIKGTFINNIFKKAVPHGIIIGFAVSILYLSFTLGLDEIFNHIQVLNITTLFISLASFIPLIDSSKPFNIYRRIVFIIAVVLFASLYIWSIYGINWLFINGANSAAPRYITWEELLAILIMIISYIIIFIFFNFIANNFHKVTKYVRFKK